MINSCVYQVYIENKDKRYTYEQGYQEIKILWSIRKNSKTIEFTDVEEFHSTIPHSNIGQTREPFMFFNRLNLIKLSTNSMYETQCFESLIINRFMANLGHIHFVYKWIYDHKPNYD